MKTFVLSGLLAVIIMSSFISCKKIFGHEPDTVFYNLDLSFQDVSSNDLVKGIGLLDEGTVQRDLYVLNIIGSQSCEESMASWKNRPGSTTPMLGISRFSGFSFLTSNFSLFAKDCPNEKILTYNLKCPYVFNDEAEHEFVTYWEVPKIDNNNTYAKCIRVEFEGKVFTPVMPQGDYSSKVIIILEGEENND